MSDAKQEPRPPLPEGPRRALEPPAQLPPVPGPPKRSLTPNALKSLRSPDLDAPTPARNETAALYVSFVQIFDVLMQSERVELLELAETFVRLTPHHKRVATVAIRNLLEKQEAER